MDDLENEIDSYLQSQIKVTFRGKHIRNLLEVENQALREDECCMRDYVTDDYGKLIEVNFDVIREM